jgi:lipopolysaccharide/colanic/teichoic acid biosynthesis glycosyltransferase
VLKRTIDLLGACIGLVVLAPLLTALAVLVYLTQGRPVLFVQERPGLNGRPFRLMKFRTMRLANADEVLWQSDQDRLTPFGRWLRSTSLDELPELWNVVRGEMSLVGPRPLLTEYLPLYTQEQAKRHSVRPGITGWAQINGRNAISWEHKFELDVWYVENISLWLDFRILAKTLWYVIRRRGVSAAGEATVARFRGIQRGGSAREMAREGSDFADTNHPESRH